MPSQDRHGLCVRIYTGIVGDILRRVLERRQVRDILTLYWFEDSVKINVFDYACRRPITKP